MATLSSILAWRTPQTRGAWTATAHGVKKSQARLSTSLYIFLQEKKKSSVHKLKWIFKFNFL